MPGISLKIRALANFCRSRTLKKDPPGTRSTFPRASWEAAGTQNAPPETLLELTWKAHRAQFKKTHVFEQIAKTTINVDSGASWEKTSSAPKSRFSVSGRFLEPSRARALSFKIPPGAPQSAFGAPRATPNSPKSARKLQRAISNPQSWHA